MKFTYQFILLCLAYLFHSGQSVFSEGALAQTKKLIRTACKNKTGVTDAALLQAWSKTLPFDKAMDCYSSCALGMMQVMKSGKIDKEGAKKQTRNLMPERFHEPLNEQIEKCYNVGGADPCEIGGNFVKCAYKVNPASPVIPF